MAHVLEQCADIGGDLVLGLQLKVVRDGIPQIDTETGEAPAVVDHHGRDDARRHAHAVRGHLGKRDRHRHQKQQRANAKPKGLLHAIPQSLRAGHGTPISARGQTALHP